jgi:uncharacterized delta-60 repeat protein
MRVSGLSGRLAVALAVGWLATGVPGPAAQAASWRLDSSFGKQGVAGLPVREEGINFLYPPGPGDKGSLLSAGPQGSLFVGGYANRKKGSFLVARMSAQGKLVTGFGSGGVSTVPAIYSTPQTPPRMFALAGGKLLVAGLNRADQFVVARLTARGQADRTFGHDGAAQYKLPNAHGHAIIAAAAVEPDGDILAVYYQKEAPQPVNHPRIAPGLGEGPIELVRLLPSGALDRSFGQGGFLKATGQPPTTREGLAVGVTIAPDGSILIAYEEAIIPHGNLTEVPAVQELSPAGMDASGFGYEGVAFLPFVPSFEGESSVIFGGLLALPGGAVEVSFGGGGQLFRFTPTGTPDPTFGTSGHTTVGPAVSALAIAPDGETFSVDNASRVTVGGMLASGAPDPALGGRKGMQFAANLPGRRPHEEQQALELLPSNDSLSILVGEDIVRISE